MAIRPINITLRKSNGIDHLVVGAGNRLNLIFIKSIVGRPSPAAGNWTAAEKRRARTPGLRDEYKTMIDLSSIYWLGGAPCSGKSSIARRLAQKHGLTVFASDEGLYPHMRQADPARQPVMAKVAGLGWDELWMRPVAELLTDALEFYREEFDLLLGELAGLPADRPILAEGNAWLPELLEGLNVPPGRTAYLAPSRAFQLEQYARREFIGGILAQCRQPETAFQHWMERDARFADEIERQAQALGLPLLRVDGTLSLEETLGWVERAFGLGVKY
jgi:hypothetical protein